MIHGYVGNVSMSRIHDEITLTRETGKGFVVVPNHKSLTLPQIEDVLKRAKIPFSEFEEYLEHLIRVREGECIIKDCIDSPPLK